MILGIQIVGILFALFMLYLTFLHRKRNEFTVKEAAGWIIIWVVFLFVTISPSSIDYVVKDVLNVSRTMDFFIIAGFMLLIGVCFYMYTLVRINQKRIEQIVRKVALDEKK